MHALPAPVQVATPHGKVGLWWLDLPAHASHAAQRQSVRQQAAQRLAQHFPAACMGHIHWPPGAQHPPHLAYAAQSLQAAAQRHRQTPGLWVSWSYLPVDSLLPRQRSNGGTPIRHLNVDATPGTGPHRHALLAIAPLPVGVDVSAGRLLPMGGWAEVLRLYGGLAHIPDNEQACARRWTGLEAADKALRTGLREWSPEVAAARARCTLVELPLPHPDIAATLAWLPPGA